MVPHRVRALFVPLLIIAEMVTLASLVVASEGSAKSIIIRSREDVVQAISAHYTPKPTLMLITRAGSSSPLGTTARSHVLLLAQQLPLAFMRVHEWELRDEKDEELFKLIAPQRSLPTLSLYGSEAVRASVAPGQDLSAPPVYLRHDYSGSLINVTQMRKWVLSLSPTQYADPVTYRLLPGVYYVFSNEEVLQVVRSASERRDNTTVSRLPHLVVMVYARLTTRGSEEYLAVLNSIASQTAGDLLVLVTESVEVARLWGLHQVHSFSYAAFDVVRGVVRDDTPFTTDGITLTVETAESLTDMASALSALRETSTVTEEAKRALDTWNVSLSAFHSHSPLRRISCMKQLQHELTTLQTAVKVFFFLRESDDRFFRAHHELAVDFARRVQKSHVSFVDNFQRGRARVWRPNFKIAAFWVDAEMQPVFTSQLRVTEVPAVVVLLPLQSRRDDHSLPSEDAAYMHPGMPIGVHVVNHHDLNIPVDDSTAASERQAKDLQTRFPDTADQLLRFLSDEYFALRVQSSMLSFIMQDFRLDTEPQRLCEKAAVSSRLANRCYLLVDRTYYQTARDPASTYVHDIITGKISLPSASNEEGSGSEDSGAAPERKQTLSRRALHRIKEELQQRQRTKEERMRRKVEDDARRRMTERAQLKEAVQMELKSTITRSLRGAPRPVYNQSLPRKNRATEVRRWKMEARRIAERFLQSEGGSLRVAHHLEV